MSADGRSDFEAVFGPEDATEQGGKANADTAPASDACEQDSARLRALSEEINRQYPPVLEQTALLLYELDPERLQVQWYVTPEDFAHALRYFPGEPAGLRQVLRLCRLEADGRDEVVDRAVTLASASTLQGQQRFAPEQTGAQYLCELGLESGDGGWLMLVRSNRVRLAGERFQPAVLGPAFEGAQAQSPGPGMSAAPHEQEELRVEAALASKGEPLYPVFPNPRAADDPRHLVLSTSARFRAAGLVEHGQVRGQGTLAAYELPDMPPPVLPSSPQLLQSADDGSMSRYDPRAALSSAALRGPVHEQPGIDVQAELLVEGRAAPETWVELFGLTIRVGEDGRFSIRRPVSDPLVLSLALGGHGATKPGDSEQG